MKPVTACCLCLLLLSALPAGASSPDHSTEWILVQLKNPLGGKRSDGSFALKTGTVALDRAIEDHGVRFIDSALPKATANPKNPGALAEVGLDRVYKFHVRQGSDILELAKQFSELGEVEYAEPDYIGYGGGTTSPNDPFYGNQYAYFQLSDADVDGPEAWDIEIGHRNQVIAVLDSGADRFHEDLRNKLVAGFDFANFDADPQDDHGHGSNVSAIAAAQTDNLRGGAGACWNCRIMPIKILDQNNSGLYSWWADGMVWATDNGARIINISAGGFSSSSTLLAGVTYAYNAGVIDVSITHNDDLNSVRYPGRYAETIAVGATDNLDDRADPFCYSATSGSNYGPQIDVVAPGELILGAALGGGYNSWCGTSQAAPLVAGLVGLMRTMYPSIGREEARHLLQAGAEDRVGRVTEDTPGFDQYHGWGRVNMEQTLLGTAASITLRADGGASTTLSYDTTNPLATSYDFIRGDLSALSEGIGGVSVGSVVCLENDSVDTNTVGNEDTAIPTPGNAFFYLGRFNDTPGAGHYGGSTLNRDRFPTAGDCSL
jgi:hypothetical protein